MDTKQYPCSELFLLPQNKTRKFLQDSYEDLLQNRNTEDSCISDLLHPSFNSTVQKEKPSPLSRPPWDTHVLMATNIQVEANVFWVHFTSSFIFGPEQNNEPCDAVSCFQPWPGIGGQLGIYWLKEPYTPKLLEKLLCCDVRLTFTQLHLLLRNNTVHKCNVQE